MNPGISSYWRAIISAAILTCPAFAGDLINGSFESGFTGWTVSAELGGVSVESAPPYAPTDGSKLVAFNSVNSPNHGSISQTIDTIPGQHYQISFDAGNLAYNNQQQKLRCMVQSGGGTLLNELTVIPSNSTTGGTNWLNGIQFVFLATGPSASITFIDASDVTNGLDLVLDHIAVVDLDFTITVTTHLDENDGALGLGAGDSLREALEMASSIPGPNEIIFDPAMDGKLIALGGNWLSAMDVVIDASNLPQGLIISAGGLTRVLQTSGDVTIFNLTLANGNTTLNGAGIFGQGNLTLFHTTVTANSSTGWGGGIAFESGTLTLRDSTVSGNHSNIGGGGIELSYTTADIVSSVISGNTSTGNGGGIWNTSFEGISPVNLTDSTVSNNIAGGDGGGYYGGTGYKALATLNAGQTTFSGNQAAGDGGGLFAGGNMTLTGCTVSNNAGTAPGSNGGGIVTGRGLDHLSLKDSIVAGNTAAGFPNIGGPVNESFGTNFIDGDPQLAALGDHGGDTPTMPPVSGSPVIDAAGNPPDAPSSDQRGRPRVSGAAMDIGAVEYQQLIVNTLVDEDDGIGTGGISLRDALGAVYPGENEIRFTPGLNGGTIPLAHGQLVMETGADIDASDLPNGLTVDAGGASRVMEIPQYQISHITGLNFTGGHLPGPSDVGGAIDNHGELYLYQCRIHHNDAGAYGGGIYNLGSLVCVYSTVSDNEAGSGGGGIANHGSDVAFVSGSLVSHNTSGDRGGGIWCRGSFGSAWIFLLNSTVSYNSAGSGGGYSGDLGYKQWGVMTAINTTFSGNTAVGSGGAINTSGSANLINSTVSNNKCTDLSSAGGGVVIDGFPGTGYLHLVNSIVAANSAGSAPNIQGSPEEIAGGNFLDGDPKLAPLADYGGDTPTMPPLPGSPVIDAAVMLPDTMLTDQRGATRPRGPFPDIGAVEAFPFSSIDLVDTDHDSIDDRLEPAYGLTVGNDDSGVDSDGDGSSDAEEIANMTDPLDPNSSLRIISFTPAAGFDSLSNPLFDISFTAFPGLSYDLECDQSLEFGSPSARILSLGTINEPVGSASILLLPGHDFVRVSREP